MDLPAGMDLKYLPYGRLAHVVNDESPLCQLGTRGADYWLGTGTQREREHVGSLPLCPRCRRVLVNYGMEPVS